MDKLTNEEIQRYGRQLILDEIGKKGQEKLKAAKVLLVGAGGLGSPSAIYLAAAGVGTLGVIDPDTVELTNLHRQVIHTTDDIGKAKVLSAQEKIKSLNPQIKVIAYQKRFEAQNAREIIAGYDIIVDGTDNFPARYLINDACVMSGKPFVYGGILRFEGQCSLFADESGPCYRCFFQEPPGPGDVPSCAEAGVLGILPGIIGLIQSNEVIKYICGIGTSLKGRLLLFDALTTRFREIVLKKDPQCPMCGAERTIHDLQESGAACAQNASSDDQGGECPSQGQITVKELKQLLKNKKTTITLVDVREQGEWDIARIDGAVHHPLSSLEKNYHDIPKDKPICIYCKVGERSAMAAMFLQTKGYRNVANVQGGIQAWAEEIAPDMPQY